MSFINITIIIIVYKFSMTQFKLLAMNQRAILKITPVVI